MPGVEHDGCMTLDERVIQCVVIGQQHHCVGGLEFACCQLDPHDATIELLFDDVGIDSSHLGAERYQSVSDH